MSNSPKRGEVWLVDLGYVAKVRPCMVLSVPTVLQDRALVTMVAHTTSPRGSRFEVAVNVNFLRLGVFDAQNLVTIPDAKLIRKLGELSSEQLSQVEASVRLWLGFLSQSLINSQLSLMLIDKFGDEIKNSTLLTDDSLENGLTLDS